MWQLRNYQEEASNTGVDFFLSKNESPALIVQPTAAGKSIIIAEIVNRIQKKTIVLQPSKELLEQNISKLRALGGEASIFSASLKSKEYGNITYATIGSIVKLGSEFKNRGYTHMIIDEADRYPRKGDSSLHTFLKASEIKYVLGLTATPFKLQTLSFGYGNNYSIQKMLCATSRKKGYINFFKDIIYITQIKEMVDNNFWSKLVYEIYDINTGSLVFNSTKADYTEESLKKYYKDQGLFEKISNKLNEIDRKSILVFVPSVANAVELASKIPNSVAVYGDMNSKDRELAISEFREGKIRVIFNVNVLSVGFDHPEVDCIICARPTASLSWLYQAYGRGTRIHPNKENCLIIDFSGNSQKFGRIEDLYYKKIKNSWYLFGTDSNQLTNIPLDEIGSKKEYNLTETPDNTIMSFGKYKNIKRVKECPHSYLQWAYENVTWNSYNKDIKKGIEIVLNLT